MHNHDKIQKKIVKFYAFLPKVVFILALFLIAIVPKAAFALEATGGTASPTCTVSGPNSFSSSGIQNGQGGCVVSSLGGADRVYTSADTGYIITNDNNGGFKDNNGNTTTKQANTDTFCNSASTCISSVIYIFTVSLASTLAYIGSVVFSLGVQLTLQTTSYSQAFLTSGWAATRDIANMAFIFILIYTAMVIIFKAETAGTMKTLAAVVVMALLINFSFFFTRVVIDAGNVLAVQFYNAMPAGTPTLAASGQTSGVAQVANALVPGTAKDLTATIMQAVQVQNILNNDSFKKFSVDNNFLTNVFVQVSVYIAVGVIFALLAFAFLTVGFKFIIRIIVLWFVIIAAPLAFAARALANNKTARGLYDQWQDALLKFSFYPAIFLFIFLIITYIMQAMGGVGNGTGLIPGIFQSLNGSTGSVAAQSIGTIIATIVVRLGFVIVMLFYGMKGADQLVTHGSGLAQNFTRWASGKAGGFAYRNTVGNLSNRASRGVAGSKWANQPGFGGWFGTKLNSKILAPNAKRSFGGMRSRVQVLADKEASLKGRKDNLSKILNKERADERDIENKNLIGTLKTQGIGALQDTQIRRIAAMGQREIGALDASHLETIAANATAKNNIWNQKKMDDLEKIEKFSETDREKVSQAWQKARDQFVTLPPTQVPPPRTPDPTAALRTATSATPKQQRNETNKFFAGIRNQSAGTAGASGGGSNNGGSSEQRAFSNLPQIKIDGVALGRRDRSPIDGSQQRGGIPGTSRVRTAMPMQPVYEQPKGPAQAPRPTKPLWSVPTTDSHELAEETNATLHNVLHTLRKQERDVREIAENIAHPQTPTISTPSAPRQSLKDRLATPTQPAPVTNIVNNIQNKTTVGPTTLNVAATAALPGTNTDSRAEAERLLASAQTGIPAFMTANLRRVLEENGVQIDPQKTVSQHLDELRGKLQS